MTAATTTTNTDTNWTPPTERTPMPPLATELLLRRFYAEGITPGMAYRAFTSAQIALVERDQEEARRTSLIPEEDWCDWLREGSYLPSGIRVRFAQNLDRELTPVVHELFDWACAQWQNQ